jgi:glutathione reductase (NADPH)
MPFDFDLITLGAGSGGVAASRRAAAHGARVAVIEGSRVGGTCVIRGCVPKKLLMYAAQLGDALREAPHYGWSPSPAGPTFEMARWAAAKAAETARLEGVYRQLLEGSKVELVEGWARITGPHTVEVAGRQLTGQHLLVATGASPSRDAIEGLAGAATSDDLLDLTALPDRMAVVGGGYIAVEFASIVARLGVQVNLFYRAGLPLRGFDGDLRQRLAPALEAGGIRLMGAVPVRVQQQGATFALHMADGTVHEYPFVLNATGRRPNTRGLGLETLGIEVDAQGAVPVDEQLRTSAPGVHAIGDVTHLKNLTPVAIAQGRTLADALFGGRPLRPLDLVNAASAVFTLPPIGTAGLNEAQALAAGHRLKIYEADFRPMRQAFYGGSERSYMKLVVDADTDLVLGIHMLGADAPEIVQSLSVALTCGATKQDFDHTLAVHPTAAEEFMLMREPARVVERISTMMSPM